MAALKQKRRVTAHAAGRASAKKSGNIRGLRRSKRFPSEAERQKLRENNLAAFKTFAPDLHKPLSEYKPQSQLVFDDRGSPNVAFGAHKLYDRPVRDYVELQLRKFRADPVRIQLSPVQPTQLDRQAGQFLHDLMTRAHNAGIKKFNANRLNRQSVFLTSFGIGLAQHLDPLMAETDCKFLALVEPNFEFLYHSLEVYDWAKLFKTIAKRKGQVFFYILDAAEVIDTNIRNMIRAASPCSFDGFTVFEHYHHILFDKIGSLIYKNAPLSIMGLGFVDDEIYMLRNTYANVYTGDALLSQRTTERRALPPVFIVGSGPSLDRMYEDIRRNQDRAVIFSCGTAIRPLLNAGITPDFHLEIERNKEVVPLIEQAHREFDISPICLVATTTVDPRIPMYFKKKVFFFRAALSPAPLFCKNDECQPFGTGPTVVNGGLGFVQDVGFRDVYFFGVDLGTKNPAFRHSAHSWHNTEDGFENDIKYTMPIPANFGGVVYSNRDLIWALSEVENSIRHWGRGRFYYNCSDGARIKGAVSKLSRSITLPEIPGGKQKALDDLMKTFPVYSKEEVTSSWTDKRVRKEINAYVNDVKRVLKKYPDLEDKNYLIDMQKVFLPLDRREHAWAMVFRGTIMLATAGVEYYLGRAWGLKKYATFKKIVRSELFRLVDKIRDDVLEELGSLSKVAPNLRKIDPPSNDKKRRARSGAALVAP